MYTIESNSENETKIEFKCYSLRSIPNPITEEWDLELPKFKSYITLVNIFDLPKEFKNWRNVNPRDPDTSTPVAKAIKTTLKENPEAFFLRNRGLTILAKDLIYDNTKNDVTIIMNDLDSHGLLDGGHTFQVIQEYIEEQGKNQAFVKLEIFTCAEKVDQVNLVVNARNKSTQVPPSAIQNLGGKFKMIKESIQNEEYAKNIAWKDNELDENEEGKKIDAVEILSYLTCFDIFNYPDHTKNPTIAYSGKGSIPNKYEKDEYVENINKISPLLPKILNLRDKIVCEIPKRWTSENGTRSGFGNLKDVRESKNKHIAPLPFSNLEGYKYSEGYFYPILASFRALINKDTVNWKYSVDDVFDEVIDLLVQDVRDRRNAIDNVTQLGKDTTLWTACYKTMENYLQKRELEELKKQINLNK